MCSKQGALDDSSPWTLAKLILRCGASTNLPLHVYNIIYSASKFLRRIPRLDHMNGVCSLALYNGTCTMVVYRSGMTLQIRSRLNLNHCESRSTACETRLYISNQIISLCKHCYLIRITTATGRISMKPGFRKLQVVIVSNK